MKRYVIRAAGIPVAQNTQCAKSCLNPGEAFVPHRQPRNGARKLSPASPFHLTTYFCGGDRRERNWGTPHRIDAAAFKIAKNSKIHLKANENRNWEF